jgi:CSLREA domain-containing protein
LIAGIVAAGLLNSAPALGKTFDVTRTADTAPNGCNQGGCTLREAAIAANNRAGADTIALRSRKSYVLAIPGADEEEAATGDIDLTGPTTVRTSGRKRATVGRARKGSAEKRDQRGRKRDRDPDSGAFER